MNDTSSHTHLLKRNPRIYLPETFTVTDWPALQPYFDDLKNREINSAKELEEWMLHRSELESVLAEDMGWRYIKMTINTTDEAATQAFHFFVEEIEPHIAPYDHELNQKLIGSPFLADLDQQKYRIYLRSVRQELEIFRLENIPLKTQISTREQEYGAVAGAMTVTLDGEEMTLQQAADHLKDPDRQVREKAYLAIQDRRLQDKITLDDLFTNLLALRHQVALNAGFSNFRDYMFAAMGRFDYKPQDCFDFHDSVKALVVPFLSELDAQRKFDLELTDLKPWDMEVDVTGKAPLKPFKTGAELLAKTIDCFSRLDPFLGDCLRSMQQMGHLDLESRKGKAPGGYNYPLDETGVPFIFMNATSSLQDVVTMLHEGGHAVHSFLTMELPLNDFKHPPSEVAELASMSMELISMDNWEVFFEDPEDLKRAKRTHLESVLETFPWVATVDKFQHWLYENPEHTLEQRREKWQQIYDQFNLQQVDWSGLEAYKPYLWQKQLHIFEVPFYYIEYAMAQLGAIAVWKNYKESPAAGLQAYKNALALGYTKSIGEIYEAAGIKFDFSKAYMQSLVDFVREQMEKV